MLSYVEGQVSGLRKEKARKRVACAKTQSD